MNFKSLLVALLATSVGFVANAQETTTGETKVKVEGQNTVEGNLDNEITNAKMRAESGSKSKFSASIGVGYSGGSLEDPGADSRLDLLGGDNLEQVDLNIGLKGRMRLNKNTSMTAGIGTNIVQPFHGNRGDQDEYVDKIEVANPNIGISTYSRKGDLMVSYAAGLTYYTSEQATDIGFLMTPSVSATALYDFKNGFQTGIVGEFYVNFIDGRDLGVNIPDFNFGVHPFMEYAINDTFNLRTIWNFGLNHSRYSQADGSHWNNGKTRQSFGIGIAATRDIFLYPNVQISTRDFYADASFERSTVGFTATINAF